MIIWRLLEEFGQSRFEAGEKKGMKKGMEKNKVETAEKLLKRDLSMKFVSEITDIPTRELETIYKK